MLNVCQDVGSTPTASTCSTARRADRDGTTKEDMMNKPQPIAEILVICNTDIRRLVIHVATLDVKNWVLDEAPTFGQLLTSDTGGQMELYVSPLYDLQEVFKYMQTGYTTDPASATEPTEEADSE